jgi:two-component system heavy metal sensor histidine kinase CusS
MLNDFLTGHDELSLRLVPTSGKSAFELLRQPEDDDRVAVRKFSVEVPTVNDGLQPMQAVLLLDRRPDDRLLNRLAWTLGIAAVAGALLVSLRAHGLFA